MRRSATKARRGGLELDRLEARVLDGDVRAMRALIRQATFNTLEVPFTECELRSTPDGTGGERLLFTGYASVVNTPFTIADWLGEYSETVLGGAFTKTLGPPSVNNERGAWSTRPDSVFVVNHDWNAVPMARTSAGTSRLREDSTGLLNECDLDPGRADVNIVRSAVEARELDAMSFAFWVVRQTWDEEYMTRDIEEIDLDGGDTSVVTWPANPATTGTIGLRSRAMQASALMRSRVPGIIVNRAKVEQREGKTLSSATLETLTAMLGLLSDAGDSHGSAVDLLTDLIGDQADDTTGASSTVDDDTSATGDTPPDAASLDSGAAPGDAVPHVVPTSSLAFARARELERARR